MEKGENEIESEILLLLYKQTLIVLWHSNMYLCCQDVDESLQQVLNIEKLSSN